MELIVKIPEPSAPSILDPLGPGAFVYSRSTTAPEGSRIESSPDVCGGEPCIAGTRIPVWVLEQARRLGSSEVDLQRAYPALRLEDLRNAWDFANAHSELIERQIRENEEA